MKKLKNKKIWIWAVMPLAGALLISSAKVLLASDRRRAMSAEDLTLEVVVLEVPAVERRVFLLRSSDDLLVDAIVEVESAGDPTRVGRAGERGLMQIKRGTWYDMTRRLFGKPVTFDGAFGRELNRRVGEAYLSELETFLQKHRSEWHADERSLLLACYNAGPSRVRRAGFDLRQLPSTTRSYVQRASALHELYLKERIPRAQQMAARHTEQNQSAI